MDTPQPASRRAFDNDYIRMDIFLQLAYEIEDSVKDGQYGLAATEDGVKFKYRDRSSEARVALARCLQLCKRSFEPAAKALWRTCIAISRCQPFNLANSTVSGRLAFEDLHPPHKVAGLDKETRKRLYVNSVRTILIDVDDARGLKKETLWSQLFFLCPNLRRIAYIGWAIEEIPETTTNFMAVVSPNGTGDGRTIELRTALLCNHIFNLSDGCMDRAYVTTWWHPSKYWIFFPDDRGACEHVHTLTLNESVKAEKIIQLSKLLPNLRVLHYSRNPAADLGGGARMVGPLELLAILRQGGPSKLEYFYTDVPIEVDAANFSAITDLITTVQNQTPAGNTSRPCFPSIKEVHFLNTKRWTGSPYIADKAGKASDIAHAYRKLFPSTSGYKYYEPLNHSLESLVADVLAT